MTETIKLEIHAPLRNHTPGEVIKVPAYKGQPTELYWRRRLADAQIDGCVSVIKPVTAAPKKTKEATNAK